jgi:hypothetical protein
MGLNKGTRLIWSQWDLNLASKWGQLTFEAEQRGPRDLSPLLQYFSAYRSSIIDDHRTKCRSDVDQWGVESCS